MTEIQQLQRIFIGVHKRGLAQHIQELQRAGPNEVMGYGEDQTLCVTAAVALGVASEVYRYIVHLDKRTAETLREAAEKDMTGWHGVRNLSAWVPTRSAPWNAVFDYGHTDPMYGDPWFSEMSEEAQRITLLLVAHAILEK